MENFQVIRAEYEGLEWVVQCRATANGVWGRNWESMAAFNARSVAEQYASDCKRDNRHSYDYRVLELSALQPTHTIIFEAA